MLHRSELMLNTLIFKGIFTGNHAFTVHRQRRLCRGKNSRWCLGSGGKEPVWETRPPVALQWIHAPHVGFFEQSKHWALSSPRFIVHCWRMQNCDISVFVTCMILRGFPSSNCVSTGDRIQQCVCEAVHHVFPSDSQELQGFLHA